MPLLGETRLETLLYSTDENNVGPWRLIHLLVLAAIVLGSALLYYYYGR